MTKSVTYKFIKGQGWVAGYWEEERKWVRGESVWAQAAREWARMPLQNIPLEPRQMRTWHDPIAGRQVPRREPRQVAPQDYGVLLSEPIRTMRTAPPRERYIVDDIPTTVAGLWVGELDDE